MKSKLYKYRNIGFTFVRGYRKWTFTNGEGKGLKTLIVECPGGVKTAKQIAVQVAASLKRSGMVRDGLANAAIDRITRPVIED